MDWRFEFSWGLIDVAIDPRDWLVGFAFGECDVVIHPLPCVAISIEWRPE